MIAQAESTVVSESEWLTNYEKAIKKASKKDKNILVYFTGSDWCPPCKMLKKDFFDSAEFAAVSSDYVLLYVDIPMNKDLLSAEQLAENKALSVKLNPQSAVPLIKILDKEGNELDQYSGYSMNGDTRYHLQLVERHKQ